MSGNEQSEPGAVAPLSKIRYNFIKGNHFRVIAADGAYGGLSPSGKICMAFFNERFPIPQQTEHEVIGTNIGSEIHDSRVSQTGIVREVEAEVLMTIEHAKVFCEWLVARIKEADGVLAAVAHDKAQTNGGAE